jgi:hypothetical protein
VNWLSQKWGPLHCRRNRVCSRADSSNDNTRI